jgi:hypothetical protein
MVPAMSAAILAAATTAGLLWSQDQHPGARDGSVAAADISLSRAGEISREMTGVVPSPSRQSPSVTRLLVAPQGQTSPTRGRSLSASPNAPTAPTAPTPPTPAAQAKPAAAPAPTATAAPAQPSPSAAPASKVLDFQFQLQINGYYCGPAATRIALTARGNSPSQDVVARSLGTTTGGTNSAADTTRGLNSVLGAGVYQTRMIAGNSASQAETDRFQSDVVRSIGSGYVVVTNIVGSATDATGVWHGYGNGHYVTVVGYRDDGRTVKVADPADRNGDGTYWMSTTTFADWMAHRGYSAAA